MELSYNSSGGGIGGALGDVAYQTTLNPERDPLSEASQLPSNVTIHVYSEPTERESLFDYALRKGKDLWAEAK